MNNEEKIFPILRKLDFMWSQDPTKNFCDVWKDLNDGEFKYLTDLELEEKLKSVNPDEK